MKELASTFIQKLKNDPDYQLDPRSSTAILLSIFGERLLQVLRGSLYKLRFKQSRGFIFVGKGVIIRNPRLIETGRNLTIKDFASIQALSRKGIQFGDNVMIGRYTIIECTGVIRELGEGLRVGNNSNNDVLFGPRVSVHAENHIFERLDVPIRKQGTSRRGVKIEDDCWIGSGVIVTDGVTIGRGSVIAAGSVVTRDIPPFSVAAGVPARVIKQRNNKEGTTR